ncbi:MAG: hypothetical protein WCD47_17140 [Candidatus Sulfotelmatobacter sp.]
MEKETGVGLLAGSMAEVLTTFALGILVCTALYAFAILYEAALVRRKAKAAAVFLSRDDTKANWR